MNPCPCGYFGDPRRACSCAAGAIGRYQKRISGPLLDRIDIHLEVPRIPHEQLSDRRPDDCGRGRRLGVSELNARDYLPIHVRSDDERAELRGVEAAVDAAGGDQLVVTPFLGDA
jgi:predicted ATPase with chaperone activity